MADLVEALNLITSSRIGELYSSRETEVRGLSMPFKARSVRSHKCRAVVKSKSLIY